MMLRRFLLLAALLILPAVSAYADTADYEPLPTDIQALVGAGRFQGDSLVFRETSALDPTLTKETNLSEMPIRITSYNVCYTKLLRPARPAGRAWRYPRGDHSEYRHAPP